MSRVSEHTAAVRKNLLIVGSALSEIEAAGYRIESEDRLIDAADQKHLVNYKTLLLEKLTAALETAQGIPT